MSDTTVQPTQTHEKLPLQEAGSNFGDVAALGTSEGHALTYIAMCLEKGPFSRKELRKHLMGAQGQYPVWELASNLNFSYAEERFVSSGLAVMDKDLRKVPGHKEPIDVLVVRAVEDERVLAKAGALLEWSLQERQSPRPLALRNLFGESRPTAAKREGGVVRAEIINYLTTNPAAAEVDLASLTGISTPEANTILKEMEEDGILDAGRASDWEKRRLILTDKAFSHTRLGTDDLRPETRALYVAIDKLREASAEEVNANQLFDMIYQEDPSLDTHVINLVINSALTSPSSARNGKKVIPALLTEGAFYEGKKTKYSLAPQHADGLRGLFEKLRKIDEGDQSTISHFTDLVVDIYTDPEKVSTLLLTAKQASPQKQAISDERLVEELNEIVVEAGEVTIRAAINLLKTRGMKMSVAGASARLMDLVKKGELQARTGRVHPRKAREVTIITGVGK